VYIEAGDVYTVTGLEPGTYLLRFISGYDWVPKCSDFLRETDYSEFESTLLFEIVEPTDDQPGYTTRYEVTLHPVPLGSARTRKIDRKRFFEGDQNVTLKP
jgi:hypothetical protein